jgi:hypothetical protein
MSPLMEYAHVDWGYRNPFSLENYSKERGIHGSALREGWENIVNKSWSELVSMKDDELPEYWFTMVQSYRSRMRTERYNWDTRNYEQIPITIDVVKDMVYGDVYRQAKPFKVEEVELGLAFKNNRYHSW